MHLFKKAGLLVLPLGATLAIGSYAAADSLGIGFEGTNLAQNAPAYSCNSPSSSGLRAHIQAYAEATTNQPNLIVTGYNVSSGTSQSVSMGSIQGVTHRVRLQRHMMDLSTGLEEDQWTVDVCDGGWQPWGVKSECSRSINSSPNDRTGACSQRTFKATSTGND
jgi:hypothetical protein